MEASHPQGTYCVDPRSGTTKASVNVDDMLSRTSSACVRDGNGPSRSLYSGAFHTTRTGTSPGAVSEREGNSASCSSHHSRARPSIRSASSFSSVIASCTWYTRGSSSVREGVSGPVHETTMRSPPMRPPTQTGRRGCIQRYRNRSRSDLRVVLLIIPRNDRGGNFGPRLPPIVSPFGGPRMGCPAGAAPC